MGRPPKDRAANAQLDYWLRRAGFSNRELARAVTGRAAQEGERHVHPDESRVRRWRARGETPRAPVPRLIADLLSERVGTRLSIADIGMTPAHQAPPTGPDLPWHAQSTITALAYLTRSELMRPHTRTSADAMHIDHGDALLGPIQRWTTARPTPLGERTAAAEGRLGAADVAELREITEAFRNLDNRHGGVLSRQAVIAQVQHAVGLLNTCAYTESTGRALFSAIADLGSVAGWMSFDAGEHRCAQRLFITALHAASEGGDAATGAHILQCMARQMSHLQHYDDALDLVGLAQYGARRSLSPAAASMLAGLEARFHAILGNLPSADHAARTAEDLFDRVTPEEEPAHTAFFDRAELSATLGVAHQIAAKHAETGTATSRHADESLRLLTTALDSRPEHRQRSKAFDHLGMARTHLVVAEVDGARAETITALDLFSRLGSPRVGDRLIELHADAAAYATDPTAADLRERIVHALA
ncbi:transcriptional regulator [Streptomyces cacaoi]|uniref:transcriptional regulator n=1 Tax=Streptomyces cacaoi TaxID=1898 RepID=UPI001FD37127|nr:transcriptional regulator [Streptomyces cacaoi]